MGNARTDLRGQDAAHLTVATVGTRFLIGCILVSLGVLLATSGGSWDLTNHLLNKPETFFSPSHAVLYFGVGSAVFGSVVMLLYYRSSGHNSRVKISTKLAVTGIAVMVAAGPLDYAWHMAFGLDGLLSPTHLTLVMGMIVSSIGALLGILHYKDANSGDKVEPITSIMQSRNVRTSYSRISLLTVIGTLSVWMATSGLLYSLTLPFSKTVYFDFNPDPVFAVVFATISFPFLLSVILYSSFELAGRRFGAASITGAIFLTIYALTSIVPNESMLPTIPFYIMNMIPIVAADAVLVSHKRHSIYLAGSLLGASFFMIYYPLITHTYYQAPVMPSLVYPVYFEMIGSVYPLIVGPGIGMGILGAIIGSKVMRMLLDLMP